MVVGFAMLGVSFVAGVAGYMLIEGYDFNEAIFMTVITMSTVGFKEVQPLSDAGMLFTSILIVFSFGIFAYVVTTFTRYVVDGVFRNYYRDNKVKNRIEKLENHVIVCGYGRNGKQAAFELSDHNVPVVIIEEREHTINILREETDFLYIHGDATQDEILQFARVDSAKSLITTLPIDADNLFVVLSAKELNPKLKVISRASDDHSDNKLKRAGATNVIMPDKVGGQHMAKLVAQSDVVEFLDYLMLQSTNDAILKEISCKSIANHFDNCAINELDIRNTSGANVIGLRRADGSYIVNPTPDVTLSRSDQLFALGTDRQINHLIRTLTSD
jgi:voltage-gated potassium channel